MQYTSEVIRKGNNFEHVTEQNTEAKRSTNTHTLGLLRTRLKGKERPGSLVSMQYTSAIIRKR